MRQTRRFGYRLCSVCGRRVSSNALARTAHERSYLCYRDGVWKNRIDRPGLGTLLLQARTSADAEERAVYFARSLWVPAARLRKLLEES